MAGKIFANSRRGDNSGSHQRLEDEFTAGDLFRDVEGHIKPGTTVICELEASEDGDHLTRLDRGGTHPIELANE
jgi:hypothetical protein